MHFKYVQHLLGAEGVTYHLNARGRCYGEANRPPLPCRLQLHPTPSSASRGQGWESPHLFPHRLECQSVDNEGEGSRRKSHRIADSLILLHIEGLGCGRGSCFTLTWKTPKTSAAILQRKNLYLTGFLHHSVLSLN